MTIIERIELAIETEDEIILTELLKMWDLGLD